MTNSKTFSQKGEILAISNKSLPVSVDRLTLFVTSSETAKAKSELKDIRKQLDEVERMILEYERLEREHHEG